ncbi:ABC transporter permease [Mycoplasmatota bacterium WC30]
MKRISISKLFNKHQKSLQKGFNETFKTLMAVIIAYGIAISIILIVSDQSKEAIYWFLMGPFSSNLEIGELIKNTTPLIFSGIAACVILKAGQFNLFIEGAFYVGGFIAAIVAIYFKLPILFAVSLAVLAGGLISAAIGYIPAKLKASLNVNEFVSSIMINFVVMWIGIYLISNVVIDVTSGDNATQIIPEASKMGALFTGTNVSYAILIALAFVLLIKIFFSKTQIGYEIKMVGDNPKFANYSGINVKKRMIQAQLLGIFIAGIGGATEILSNYSRFNWKTLPGYGFDGFMVAIIAKNKPLLIPFAALFIGYLRSGADLMAFNTDVAKEVVTIIQGIVILLIASERFFSSDYFTKLKNKFSRKHPISKEVAHNE